jgi:hypothetical protein
MTGLTLADRELTTVFGDHFDKACTRDVLLIK